MGKEVDYNKIASHFAQVVPSISFMLWEKEDFRKLINFHAISKIEQDRIFNELEVSFLGLFFLYLENLESLLEGKEKELVENIKNNLARRFMDIFKDLKLEERFVKDWEVLINMRLKEYRTDYALLLHEGEISEQLKGNEQFKVTWARVETITLDCLSHIRRGKLELKDPLRRFLQDWIINSDKIFADTIKQIVFNPQGLA